ncbi:MAG: tRNA (guanosine(37)-N1)-methyltransferase TrmD [candidate division WOR-3 bacterium]|nr:tRNA (guanosine(37)-N1)-methyltransferase TrmD [candidate division WOR-3 bacterium]MCX7757943.1 tRNA (guanosine(37)-N1)-methyltransferase TrmD [candidate division WOR-3 bacterium]MDW7987290.1 tRNA (guanosine(37)-N1)-methyltransferase TrmD [candidate division WOR-3 bacterium]
MMRIHIITVFPEYFESPLRLGILRVAQEKELVKINTINLRDFADDSYRTVDDYPFGGGSGMILKPEPIFKATESVREKDSYVILLSPKGRLFTQECALELSAKPHLIFICGRYKDVDERVREHLIDDEISIGDYILAGGEAAALVILEAVIRLLEGAVGNKESVATDSFMQGLLDAPYYTRPQDFRGFKVPEVLLSGNHQKIAEWRKTQALKLTKERRPDLYEKFLKSKGGIDG